jgi:hypothetical protein
VWSHRKGSTSSLAQIKGILSRAFGEFWLSDRIEMYLKVPTHVSTEIQSFTHDLYSLVIVFELFIVHKLFELC